MIITWEDHEVAELLRATNGTEYSTGRVAEVLKGIYEANITEDIRSAIEHLEEIK